MGSQDVKGDLHDYLRGARETLVWKLEGLGEYDIRRPLTPTGTNLLGLVRHSAWELAMYFGSDVFGRANDVSLPWMDEDAEPNADMWARPEETREGIVALYRLTWDVADATIDELPLDATGRVWWWGDSPVTLHRVLVHVTANTQRHAGHADIIRESVDGAVGLLEAHDNMRRSDVSARQELHDRIEEAARLASSG
jgi:hypothetical protein